MGLTFNGMSTAEIVQQTLVDTLPDQKVLGLDVSGTGNNKEFKVTAGECYINAIKITLLSDTTIVGNLGDTKIWIDKDALLHTGISLPVDCLLLATFDPLEDVPPPPPTPTPQTTMHAAEIINIPAGEVASIDVQQAINELDTEKVGKVGSEDIEILDNNKGIILHGPSKKFRVQIGDNGVLSSNEIT